MKNLSVFLPKWLFLGLLAAMPVTTFAGTILVDEPRGSVIKLTKKGEPACGTVNWGSIRQPGSIRIKGQMITMKEAKLPLDKEKWEQLLSTVAGDTDEITIAHAWDTGPAGLAAALRVAYDIRSQGGMAWVLNGPAGNIKTENNCAGEYRFKGNPVQIYMSEESFWKEMQSGRFLDARGSGAKTPPSYTWVVGTPEKGKAVDIASFTHNGKVDTDAYGCEVFDGISVAGCDSVHKTFLAVEAAKYANCSSQPKIMPLWGLAGASRHTLPAKKLWGEKITLNEKRSGEIAQ